MPNDSRCTDVSWWWLAGGHLAFWVASRRVNKPMPPAALILLSAVLDTSSQGYGYDKLGDRAPELSPVIHISPLLPPTLLLHSPIDSVVPFEGVASFHQQLLKHNVPTQLYTKNLDNHGFYGLNASNIINNYIYMTKLRNDCIQSLPTKKNMFALGQKLKFFSLNQIRNSLTLGTVSAILTALPLCAAEKIYIVYGPLRLSLGVDSLETLGKEGVVNKELDFYLGAAGVKKEQEGEIQQALITRYDIEPIRLYRFLRTPTGEELLERIGILISLPGGRNGKYVLRGALIQAALDQEEGLTILNFLGYLATDIQLNMPEILQAINYLRILVDATEALTEDISVLSAQAASETSIDYSTLPDLRQPGDYGVQPVQVIQLRDQSRAPRSGSLRDRSFYVHLYQPQRWRQGKTPVVVVSHGLSSSPGDFADVAQQLASYGYLVALPQHPGSDNEQFQAMLEGYSRKLYELEEFINRPLDVTYLLDELERRNATEFDGRLNLDHVGVLGHSFGGYTAIALAGATLDLDNVKLYCENDVWEPNLSMLLQCRALDLPRQDYNFRDERVQAVGVMNPLNTVVFGPEGLSQVEIPVIIAAGTNDPATPAVIEQIRSFVWLNTPDKYLVVMKGQAHFLRMPKVDSKVKNLVDSVANIKSMDLDIINLYGNTLATAFSQVYVAREEEYRVYLQSGYWQYISTEPNPIYFVDSSAVVPLSESYNRLAPADIPHNILEPAEIHQVSVTDP